MRGQNASLGDERQAPNGYWYIKCESGWRLKHHLKAEEHLGRPLAYNERVSFKDGDKENYDPANLLVAVKKNTKQDRIAKLRERIEALQAELKDLER